MSNITALIPPVSQRPRQPSREAVLARRQAVVRWMRFAQQGAPPIVQMQPRGLRLPAPADLVCALAILASLGFAAAVRWG